jgi:pyridoxine 4-dehydrogenase
VQNQFSRLDQNSADVLAECEMRLLAFIPWYPLASGKAAQGHAVKLPANVAQNGMATRAQLSIAWRLKKPPVVLPIPGASSVIHLEENIASASLGMSLDLLNKVLG